MRIGPSTDYAVSWMYMKSGMPVEIIQEYENWRRIRDADGTEGWVNQALLSGERTAVAAPWMRGKGKDVYVNMRRDAQSGASEAGGEKIACTCRIDHIMHRIGLYLHTLSAAQDNSTFFAHRHRRDLAIGGDFRQRQLEIVGFVKRKRFLLVGENDVHRAGAHQVEKFLAVTADAETVGQRHGNFAAIFMRNAGAFANGVLGARRIPQVTFEIGDLGLRHDVVFDVFRAKIDASAKIGVHRTLAVFGDEDHRTGGRRKRAFRLRFEIDALRADIVLEDFSELVFGDLAEIGGLAAEIRNARGRVAGTSARGFESRPHQRIKQLGPFRIDEVHRAFGNGIVVEKAIIAARDDVDDGIADSQYVEFRHRPYPVRTRCVRIF
ncbi:hypothetical protein SOVF_206750 [Spinacia oleracea]|nr:hypothetical protein SOVF_206750 [Spinacia oleracea]